MTSHHFKPGQRIVVANGTVQVVAKMLAMTGEPLRVEVEDGPAWLASECELAPTPAGSHLVRCEEHAGQHVEIVGCVWPHYVGPDGVEPQVGHPDLSTD